MGLKQRRRLGVLMAGVLLAAPVVLQAAVEKEYQETEIDMPRDDGGVQLNDAEDVRRAMPEDRKMNSIISNVVKAEERDQYTSRLINEVRKELNDRIDILETRLAEIQGQILGVKQTLVRSGVVKKTTREASEAESGSGGKAQEAAAQNQAFIY